MLPAFHRTVWPRHRRSPRLTGLFIPNHGTHGRTNWTYVLPRRNGDMASDLILWGVGTSRTMRAHWAMHELSLSYECRPIRPRSGETEKPEFTQLNARKKIPLLQDGDFTIGESAAIVAYLSRAYSTPDCSLIPGGDRDFAKWLEWCFFIMTELDSTSLYVMRRHRELGHIYGHAPEVVE